MNTTKKIRLLHVDDDQHFQDLFRSTYCDEFEILSRPSGKKLVELLGKERIDALVLDYELPGQNGLDILRDVRARFPSMPVIFYTGQGSETVARQAFKAGATDYFVKESTDFAQKEKMVNAVQKAVEKCSVEALLAEKQAMLESFIEYNPYAVAITDSTGHAQRVNRAHTKRHGMSPSPGDVIFDEELPIPKEAKEAINQAWYTQRETYSCFNDENALKDENARKIMPLWEKGEVVRFPPFWYIPPFPVEGTPIKPTCVGVTGFSLKDSSGKIQNYVQMYEDITARVEAEEALKKSHEELQRAYASVEQKVTERTVELAEANDKLADTNKKLQAEIAERSRLQAEVEKRNTELEDFAHMVSHDLRNNLLVMQRLMEAATLSRGDIASIHESLIENTGNLRDFVERLLSLAQAGKSIGQKVRMPLDLCARQVFPTIAAAHKGAKLKTAEKFPPVLCDPGAFEQIFSNLFANALVHARESVKPLIEVGFKTGKGSIDIIVKDNGKGIEAGVLPRVFDVTFTTHRAGRFGFGLAIVKKLVEAHGGSVHAESEGSGKGAAFIITLPHGA